MVTISNGKTTLRVTAGAVETYKSMGFHVVDDKENDQIKPVEHNKEEKVAEDVAGEPEAGDSDAEDEGVEDDTEEAYVTELLEKPLSQWSNEEVKEFVRIKGIDTSGAKKFSQVKDIIKAYLDEQVKNANS